MHNTENLSNFVCDFSLRHYTEVLRYVKKNYTTGTLKEFEKLRKKNQFIIFRHDVDLSIDQALNMAILESKNGIKSTYFILLHSPYYNALSGNNIDNIKKIQKYGHEIGLHYDTSIAKSKKHALKLINNEAELLGNIIGDNIVSIAPHNPSWATLPTGEEISGDTSDATVKIDSSKIKFIDAMNPKILNSVKYISDSVQNWRAGCMCNHIGKEKKLIILTHPIWWFKHPKSRNHTLKQFENKQMKDISEQMEKAKKSFQKYIKQIHR